jgi:hypothetical protein
MPGGLRLMKQQVSGHALNLWARTGAAVSAHRPGCAAA